MSLIKAINFRHLSSQLTHQERLQFLSQLIHSHTDIIFTSLFQRLSQPNQINQVNDFNNRLSNIIQSRKEKPEPLCMRNIKLDQFPRAIIGCVASFLKQRSYLRFSKSNRSIYLGCNSPNTLQTLSLFGVKDYSSVKLSSFPSVRMLQVNASKAIQSRQNMSFDSPNFNQITNLQLDATNKRDCVEPFVHQNIVNCDNIITLQCKFGSDEHKMGSNEFLSFLARFPNVTRLRIFDSQFTHDVTAQDIADLCPKLVGLNMANRRTTTFTSDLVKIFAGQLQYLSLLQSRETEFDFGNVVFSQLQELGIFFPDSQLLGGILKSAANLKKVYMMYRKDWMSEEEIKNSIANVMTQCKCLNYMRFAVDCPRVCTTQFRHVLEGIERGLFKTKQQQRKQLKVRIYVSGLEFKPSDFALNVGRVVNSLCTSNVNEFMLIWHFKNSGDKASLENVFRNLCNLSQHIKVIKRHKQFIISNENCKINGYQDEFNFLHLPNL